MPSRIRHRDRPGRRHYDRRDGRAPPSLRRAWLSRSRSARPSHDGLDRGRTKSRVVADRIDGCASRNRNSSCNRRPKETSAVLLPTISTEVRLLMTGAVRDVFRRSTIERRVTSICVVVDFTIGQFVELVQ